MYPSPDRAAPRVLVVDDDALLRELLITRLTLGGYQTFWAGDGFEALQRCSEVRPNAVVLDMNMPRLDGFGFLERLPTMPGPAPRVMVLTARNQSADVQKAIKLGAHDFLTKPFDEKLFLQRVARLLRPVG
ncbi:MAG: response regulator [Phenylobacterium sp.]